MGCNNVLNPCRHWLRKAGRNHVRFPSNIFLFSKNKLPCFYRVIGNFLLRALPGCTIIANDHAAAFGAIGACILFFVGYQDTIDDVYNTPVPFFTVIYSALSGILGCAILRHFGPGGTVLVHSALSGILGSLIYVACNIKWVRKKSKRLLVQILAALTGALFGFVLATCMMDHAQELEQEEQIEEVNQLECT